MKKTIITGCLFLFLSASFAQKQWTLRECIDYAIKNNIEIRQQEIKKQNAEISLSTAKNSRLPNLNASVGQNFNFGLANIQTINPDGTYSTTYKNTSSSNSSISVGSSVSIFNGFRTSNEIKAQELNLMYILEGLAKAKDDLALNVAVYYLDILFKKEILRVYQEQEKLSALQIQRTQELKDAGKVPESQLFDMISQHATNQKNVVTASNTLNTSMLELTQALNITSPEGFEIAIPEIKNVVSENTASIQPPNNIFANAVAIKPVVKQAEYNLKYSEKNLKIAQAAYYPELSLSLGIGTGYYSTSGESFGQQLKNRRGENISLNLSIPIFNRFATRNSVRTARNEILNSQLLLENMKLALYKDIQQAYYNAVGAQAKYESSQKAVAAAEIAFSYMKDKYAVGKATVFEYNESQTKLISSQSDLLQAKYDYIFRAKILDFYNGKEIVL